VSFTDKCEKYGSSEMPTKDRRLNWRKESRYSSVSIVTRLLPGGSGGSNPVSDNTSPSTYLPQRLWNLPRVLFHEYEGSSPWTKRPGRDVDHGVPVSNTEVKNEWSYASSTLTCFMVWTGKNFTF